MLLGLVIYRVDWRQLLSAAGRLDLLWISAAMVAVYVAIAVKSYKWGLILRSQGLGIGFGVLFDFYLVGLFFNNFLPTSIGGDIVRGFELARRTGDGPHSAASIVTERLIAGASLGLTALVGLAFVPATPKLVGLVTLFAAGCLGLVVLFMQPRLGDRLVGASMGARFENVRLSVGRTASIVRQSLADAQVILRVGLLSVLFQMVLVSVNLCIFRALGQRVDLGHTLIYVPVISALTMLPVSLSGLGVREAAYVYFFTQIGVPGSDAVTASLVFFAAVGVASLPGAVLFGLRRQARQEDWMWPERAEV